MADIQLKPSHQYAYAALADAEEGDAEGSSESPKRPQSRRGWIVWLAIGSAFGSGILASGIVQHWRFSRTPTISTSLPDNLFAANISHPSTPSARPPIVLHYDGEDSLNERPPIYDCPIPVLYTKDATIASAIIYNSDKHGGSGIDHARARLERPYQSRVIWGSESAPNRQVLEEHFSRIREGRANETFDYDMTYRLDGAVPGVYAYGYMNFHNKPLPFEEKRQDRIAAAFISNCGPRNARNLVLDELMALLPGQIDSFGPCKNNANAETVLREKGRWDMTGEGHTRWNLAMYKFTIAMENSNEIDYVTEKAFQPFEFGSVPIHLGSPTFNQSFLPAINSAIDLADYLPPEYLKLTKSGESAPTELSLAAKKGLQVLADRLLYLGSEDGREDYEKMLAWKNDNLWETESPFGKVVALGRKELSSDCRLGGILRGESWGQSGWTPSSWDR